MADRSSALSAGNSGHAGSHLSEPGQDRPPVYPVSVETKREAHASVKRGERVDGSGSRAARQRQRVLEALRPAPGWLTREEIEVYAEIPGNSVRPRICELLASGLIRESGERRETLSGRRAAVLVAVDPEARSE